MKHLFRGQIGLDFCSKIGFEFPVLTSWHSIGFAWKVENHPFYWLKKKGPFNHKTTNNSDLASIQIYAWWYFAFVWLVALVYNSLLFIAFDAETGHLLELKCINMISHVHVFVSENPYLRPYPQDPQDEYKEFGVDVKFKSIWRIW